MLMIQHYLKVLVGQDINNVSQTLNHDLKKLKDWSDQNMMFINTQKTTEIRYIGNVAKFDGHVSYRCQSKWGVHRNMLQI